MFYSESIHSIYYFCRSTLKECKKLTKELPGWWNW